MAKNIRFGGNKTRSLPVPSGTKSGAPVKVGSLVGVALTDRQGDVDGVETGNPTGFATVALGGGSNGCAADLTVTGALAAAGTPVYIASNGSLTATATDNTLFGYSIPGATDGTKGTGAGVITVELVQV